MTSGYTGKHCCVGQNTPAHDTNDPTRPWQSWESTVRFVIVCLAKATPYVGVAWDLYLRR